MKKTATLLLLTLLISAFSPLKKDKWVKIKNPDNKAVFKLPNDHEFRNKEHKREYMGYYYGESDTLFYALAINDIPFNLSDDSLKVVSDMLLNRKKKRLERDNIIDTKCSSRRDNKSYNVSCNFVLENDINMVLVDYWQVVKGNRTYECTVMKRIKSQPDVFNIGELSSKVIRDFKLTD